MAKKKPPSADDNLLPGQFADINEEFYRGADPVAYFRRRREALNELRRADEFDERDLDHATLSYLAADSITLFHHTAESLIRLVLAHLDDPDCPWLELARLKQRGAFPKQLDRLIAADEPNWHERIATVLLGGPSPETSSGPEGEASWRDVVAAEVAMLSFLARLLKDQSTIYNSMKHGFSVIAGPMSISMILDEETGETFGSDGLGVTYFETHTARGQGPRWRLTTEMINARAAMMFTDSALKLMESLWTVARLRRLGLTGGQVWPITLDDWNRTVHTVRPTYGPFKRMSHWLRYLEPSHPEG